MPLTARCQPAHACFVPLYAPNTFNGLLQMYIDEQYFLGNTDSTILWLAYEKTINIQNGLSLYS